jgi:glucosamine--fructose-6-phosphate aminotransferase (isomerizing)
MCGIVGYVGHPGAFDTIIGALTRLGYRGYDSAGVALVADDALVVRRTLGAVANLATAEAVPADARVGVGHTRWATHGRPSVANAHPHVDCTGGVAVVHNGIIENHQALRELLTARGHRFRSDTDTEVVAHLLEEHAGGALETTVRKVVDVLQGDFALVIVSAAAPDRLVAARSGSPPLLLGLGDGEQFLASDVLALTPYTDTVVALEEGDVAVLVPSGVDVIDRRGEPARRASVDVTWRAEDAARGRHAHFMHKEIHEQPAATRRAFAGRVDAGRGSVALEGPPLRAERWRTLDRVTLIGCGTAYHAALLGRRFFERLARLPVAVEVASEFRYQDPLVGPGDVCIGVSQSGETADTLGALRVARRLGADVLGVCNVPGSAMTREVHGVVMTRTGPEIGVASTKAFIAQVVALLLLALDAGRARGAVGAGETAGLLAELERLPDVLATVLARESAVADVARACRPYRDFFFLGRGLAYPVALEAALKLKEIAYVHAEAFPAGEMKHGPLALIDGRTVTFALTPDDATRGKMLGTIEEVRARDGRVLFVGTEGDDEARRNADWAITLPRVDERLAPCVLTVPLQLFAYHTAVLAGHDVDRPRNLAKSVTVE